MFRSSDGSGNMSTTFKGILVGLVPVAIYLAKSYNLPVTEEDIMTFIQHITTIASSIIILIGIGKKVYNYINGYGVYSN